MRIEAVAGAVRRWPTAVAAFATAVALTAAVTLAASTAAAAPVKTEHVTAELLAAADGVSPGATVTIGLRLAHIPHWHTYWRNPGDSGLPTTIAWTLPAGSTVGEIDWPAPQRLPIGPLVNYGYEGEVVLPMRYTAPPDARPGDTLALRAEARWLVCSDVCIPEKATLDLALPVVVSPGAATHAARFARAAAAQPVQAPDWRAEVQQAGRDWLLTLAPAAGVLPADAPPIQVFPEAEQLIEPARHAVFRAPAGYAVRLALAEGAAPPATLRGIAVVAEGAAAPWGPPRAIAFEAPVRPVAALALPAGAQPLVEPPAAPAGGAPVGLLAALGLAFAGGLLLNLMPCVFPVLSIKLLGLARQHGDRAALRRHAAAYTAGVLGSFLVLAAALLALRAAGSAVGWGFQLQEPGVVLVLALLFFGLGLNLAGAFEFGHWLPPGAAAWRDRRPAVDAFASGVLAVVAASPCTAPFMGAALGYAATQSPLVALAVFAALGTGMALPYVALVLRPRWQARLPAPGAWMLRLKQGLAFPMFATVVWLLWVFGQQVGLDAATRLLALLLVLGFALWLAGLGPLRHAAARGAIALGVLAAAAWAWPPRDAGAADGARGTPVAAADAAWEPYDEEALARHVAQGRAVFVDFTAAWCVSCQVNKRLVLHTDTTMADFARAKVVLMRADWTRRDPRITAALDRLGRNGVPVYLLLRPGRAPVLLPEILTPRLVREALATLPS